MDTRIKEAQKRLLKIFSEKATRFALAGGTALELYYFHHRFSWDLDFFSPTYDLVEIDRIMAGFQKQEKEKIELEAEFLLSGWAKVRFYSMPIKKASRPLKIDFIEDVLSKEPVVHVKEGIRVYSAEAIYFQKIAALTGTRPTVDPVGRSFRQGRNEARDVFDIYFLSRKIRPLHKFLQGVPVPYQKGMIHWYRGFSRQDLKLSLLDMDIYDPQFNSREMISYLENEIKQFAKGIIGEL